MLWATFTFWGSPLLGASIEVNQKTHRLKLNDQISHFHTPDAQKSWRDMAAQKFTPSDGQFHFGLDYDTTWIRFSLKNTASMPLDFYLEIDYAIIASLELYTLQGDDAKRQVTGTDVPFKKRPDPYRNPIFKIKTPAQSETTFYLKADSLGPKIMPLQLLSPAEMFAQRESEKSYFGFYYGVIFSIMLINTLTFFTFREKIYLYYVGLLSSLHVILIPYAFGINLPYLLPHSGGLGSTIGSLSQVAVAIFFVLFTRELLNLKTLHPKIAQIYKGLMVLSVVFGAKIILFGDHVEDLYLMPVVLTSLLFLAFAGSYNGIKARQAHAILFVVSWSGVFVGMVVFMMTIFNVFDFLGGRFILLAGAEMEAIFLSLAIHFKIKAVKKDHDLAQTKVDQIQTYLNHLVPQSFMNEIMSNPEILTGPPRSKEITIMFVDMVAFSRITERKDAAEVFKRAKASLDELRHSIKKHNGVIDRSLGDGILCFFGYQSDQSRESSALEASRCAIEIQTKAARRLASETNTDLSFCYRIGINTDIVSIGNMGSETAPDFTVAGQGVVAAARFETSCDPFMILMGEHTYSYLKKSGGTHAHSQGQTQMDPNQTSEEPGASL